MSRFAAILLTLLTCTSLAACGLKGPLVLPPGPVPEPLLGTSKPASKSAATDVSTPQKAQAQ